VRALQAVDFIRPHFRKIDFSHSLAFVQTRWRPLQAMALGLALMGGAFRPLLATSAWVPVTVLQAPEATLWSRGLPVALTLSPVGVSAMLLMLGTMLVQPFALSLIPRLGDH
jgi:hypothetical protein